MANLVYHSTQIAFFAGSALVLVYILKKNNAKIARSSPNKSDLR